MKIVIPGEPIPKRRARFKRIGARVMTYDLQDPLKKDVVIKMVAALNQQLKSKDKMIAEVAGSITRGNAFEVFWDFYLPIPASDKQGARNAKLWGMELPTSKPDYDNLEKFYLDCANGVLWPDDRMIVSAHASKHYSDTPRVEIKVMLKKELKINPEAEKILRNFTPSEAVELLNDIGAKELSSLDTELSLRVAAKYIHDFASKYATVLKKIEKLPAPQMGPDGECKAALQSTKLCPTSIFVE